MNNPFDRDLSVKPLAQVIVHTPSFEQEILAQDTWVEKILNLHHLPSLSVLFTPSENRTVRKRFSECGISIMEYRNLRENSVDIKLSSSIATIQRARFNIPINEDCVDKLDIEMAIALNRDFYIVNKKHPSFGEFHKVTKVHEIEDVFEKLRILLVNGGVFFVSPNYRVGEWLYYLYRYKKLFSNFQLAWSISMYAQQIQDDNIESLNRQLKSLSQRLNLICRASDKAMYFSLKTPSHDTTDEVLYHLSYLVLLITGTFDDLAWIIKYRYSLELNDKQIDLRYEEFINLLNRSNYLYDYLENKCTQNKIKLFYPVRNELMHQEFLSGSHTSGGDFGNSIMLMFPPETIKKLKNISSDDQAKSWGVFEYPQEAVEPYHFATKAISTITEIVNSVLENLEWEDLLKRLPENKQKSILESQSKFEKGVGHFLDWPQEPDYF